LKAAQVDAANVDGLVNAAKAALRSVMGLAWDAPLDIKGELSAAEPLSDLKTFIGQAMQNHPDLQRAQADVRAAEAAVRVAESQRKAQASLNSTLGVQDKALPPTRGLFVFGVTARFPFMDGGQAKAEIAEAKDALASAQAALKQIKLDVERKVSQAWYLAQSAQLKIEAVEKAIQPAQKSLELAEAQYRAGVGTLLGVKDAQVQLLIALNNRTNAIYDFRLEEAQLHHAAGRLVSQWVNGSMDDQMNSLTR
jgi:outer membrane protein TolC